MYVASVTIALERTTSFSLTVNMSMHRALTMSHLEQVSCPCEYTLNDFQGWSW